MQASSVWQARVGSDHHNICIRSTESEPDPVHRLGKAPARSEMVDGHTKRTWSNASGETYTITGMGHGMPLRTGGEDGLGAAGPFMLDVGISSTRRIAEFWGIAEPRSGKSAKRHRQGPEANNCLLVPIRPPWPIHQQWRREVLHFEIQPHRQQRRRGSGRSSRMRFGPQD